LLRPFVLLLFQVISLTFPFHFQVCLLLLQHYAPISSYYGGALSEVTFFHENFSKFILALIIFAVVCSRLSLSVFGVYLKISSIFISSEIEGVNILDT